MRKSPASRSSSPLPAPTATSRTRTKGAAARFPAKALAGAGRDPLPAVVEPCLATLVAEVPKGEQWVHEIKWDGYRLMIRIDRGRVTVLTRRGHDWTARFPTIAEAARRLPVTTAMIDGEAVIENGHGVPDFGALQAALGARDGPGHKAAHEAVLYAFDLLHVDGRDLRGLPLTARKRHLADLVPHGADGTLRHSEHNDGDGAAMWRHACRMGLEGVVSKRGDCPYRSGRSGDWLKIKCTQRQELVVAGYLPRSDAPRSVGALVLGYYDVGALVYAGRVGTGFNAKSAAALWKQMQPLRARLPAFAETLPSPARKGVTWVEPNLVAEVEFRGWTSDGLVRHAAFKALREDKDPREVTRERADA
jgi:bifunctional non-homologous end joining protein LigD